MKRHFTMFAAYNTWANNRVYDAAATLSPDEWNRDAGAFFKSMMGTLNHLLATDRIWLKRMTGLGEAPSTLDAIIHRDFDKLRAARSAEDRRFVELIDGMSDQAFAGRFTYVTVGDVRTISQRFAPALSHLFNHQTHHRGQAHMILTVLGRPSLTLDLMAFQRTPEGVAYA